MMRQTELMEQKMGNLGSKEITGTSPVLPDSGVFTAIYFVEATVVAAQVDADGITNADLTVFTSIPADRTIYGKWTSITLTSGSAIGYNGT